MIQRLTNWLRSLNRSEADRQTDAELAALKTRMPHLGIRYLELRAMRDKVRQTVAAHGLEPVMYDQLIALDEMVAAYLRLAQAYMTYREQLERQPVRKLEKDLERTRAKTEEAAGETRDLLAENQAVLEARLEMARRIEATTHKLKSQLDTLEDTVHLIQEQALTASSPQDVHVDFERVRAGVAATDAALAETRALLRMPETR